MFRNVKAVLAEAGLGLENVVKTTVFMTDLGQFGALNAIYAEYFAEPYPARSCVEVSALPKGVWRRYLVFQGGHVAVPCD